MSNIIWHLSLSVSLLFLTSSQTELFSFPRSILLSFSPATTDTLSMVISMIVWKIKCKCRLALSDPHWNLTALWVQAKLFQLSLWPCKSDLLPAFPLALWLWISLLHSHEALKCEFCFLKKKMPSRMWLWVCLCVYVWRKKLTLPGMCPWCFLWHQHPCLKMQRRWQLLSSSVGCPSGWLYSNWTVLFVWPHLTVLDASRRLAMVSSLAFENMNSFGIAWQELPSSHSPLGNKNGKAILGKNVDGD